MRPYRLGNPDRPTKMTSPSASITNALMRCIRKDEAAGPAFELVRADLGLWVLELDFDLAGSWSCQIHSLCDQIEKNRVRLAPLREGSSDFTFHLSVETNETLPLRIPPRLSQLASECGFEIEIHIGPP